MITESPSKLHVEAVKDIQFNIPTRILLGPGPSMVDPRVLRAMSTPLVGHLDPSFLALMDVRSNCCDTLSRRVLFVTCIFWILGTGNAAMEAAIGKWWKPGMKHWVRERLFRFAPGRYGRSLWRQSAYHQQTVG